MNTLTIILTEVQLEDLAKRIADKLSPTNRQPLNTLQASKALGLAPSTIALRVRAGQIKRVPETGKKILIPISEIERLQNGGEK